MLKPARQSRIAISAFAAALLALLGIAGPAAAQTTAPASTGGAAYMAPPPPAEKAQIVNGLAIPPISAPPRVVAAIEYANQIVGKPYRYGGGHKLFTSAKLDAGYDCSGSVSHALRGGRFLKSPLDSSSFMKWGEKGLGQWITVYTAPHHAYVVIAGLRFDTSMRESTAPGRTGPAWSTKMRSTAGRYVARHPDGY